MKLSWKSVHSPQFKNFFDVFSDYGPNQTMIDATLSNHVPGQLYLKDDGKSGALLVTNFGYAFGWAEAEDLQDQLLQVARSQA